MSKYRLAIATCAERPDLISNEQYLLDRLVLEGIDISTEIWNDQNVNWSRFDGVLVRSIWDYHKHIDAFHNWVDQLTELDLQCGNPVETLHWNAHKYYLNELGKKGINIPATQFIPKGSGLGEVKIPWESFIIKPAVSATAFQTFRLTPSSFQEKLPAIQGIVDEKDILIQEFIPSVSSNGEYSMVFFDKKFSHAVLKTAQKGEYRVQEEYGGSYESVSPDDELVNFSKHLLSTIEQPCLYARVDLVIHDQEPMLMELELIEPELFLLTDVIRERFVRSIKDYFLGN